MGDNIPNSDYLLLSEFWQLQSIKEMNAEEEEGEGGLQNYI